MFYPPQHLILSLDFSTCLRNARKLEGAVQSALNLMHGLEKGRAVFEAKYTDGFKAPGLKAIRLAQVKIDCASNLCRRRRFRKDNAQMILHLNPDASPQELEAFLCKEFVTRGGDVRNAETSIMPYTSLSHKHMGVIDKWMCIMHMVFLRAGLRQVHMQLYGAHTRQVLSDLVSELRLGDIVDMSGPHLRGGADISVDLEELKGTFFFPDGKYGPWPRSFE